MITIKIPDATGLKTGFAHISNGFCLGPFTRNGDPIPYMSTQVRLASDHKPKQGRVDNKAWWALRQRYELEGEKPVSHTHTQGTIEYMPIGMGELEPWSERYERVNKLSQYFDWTTDWDVFNASGTYYRKTSATSFETWSFTGSTGNIVDTYYLRMIVVRKYEYTGEYVISSLNRPYARDSWRFSSNSFVVRFSTYPSIRDRSNVFRAWVDGGLENLISNINQFSKPERYSTEVENPSTYTYTALFPTVYGTPHRPSPSALLSAIDRLYGSPLVLNAYPELKDVGSLVGEAAASSDKLSANMIAFTRDLKDIKSLIPKLKNLGSLKTHASNYLGMEYGVMPTISDLDAIVGAFKKHDYVDREGNTLLTAGHSSSVTRGDVSVSGTARVRLAVGLQDDRFGKFVKSLRDSGFYPSPQNLYDLIPYSFVVDWFVDIGGFLEELDTQHRIAQLPIVATTSSTRYEIDINAFLHRLYPSIKFDLKRIVYNRKVYTSPPKPSLSFDSEVTAQNHLVEGAALVITRR